MNIYSVLKKPILSEKSNDARESEGKYTFLVDINATKGEIKSSVEKLFEVNVLGVNTCITRGKTRRRGMHVSRESNQKKAVVTLRQGQKLALFDAQ